MDKMKKLFALLLAAVTLFTLSACGKKTVEPTATPTPEMVYASEFKTFSETYQRNEANFNVILVDEKGFIGTVSEKVGEREPEEGEIISYEGQLDIYEQRIYLMDFDGKMTKLAYEPLPVSNGQGVENTTWLNGIIRTDSGFLTIEEGYLSWNDAPEGLDYNDDDWYRYYHYEDHYYLRTLDAEGRELNCTEMDLSSITENGEYVNLSSVALLEDGTLLTNGENKLYAFDASDGRLLYEVETDFEWMFNILQTGDGEVYVAGYCEEPNKGWVSTLKPYTAKNRSLGESLSVDGDFYSAIPGSGQYLIYYTSGSNFYGYDKEKQESVKLFNWLNVDVLNDDLMGCSVLPDGRVVGILTEWDKNYENATRTLVTIREVPSSSLPEKTVLTLASDYLDWNLRREMIRFNRSNENVRIELLDYSEYDDYSVDYDENGYGEAGGLTKLRTEILAGNMPDILDLGGMPTRQLAAKGLLMDLYPLLDADPELSRDDIFPNVLKAMETGGKLTSVSSSFYIWTCVGARAVVGDTPGWTYRQLNEALANMPEDCTVFGVTTTRDSVLQTMLQLDMGQFVDWNTGKVSFDSQDFIDLLTFVKEFPATFDWENYEWSEEDNDYNRVREGRQLLIDYGVSGMSDLIQCETLFGGPDSYTVIGYPTAEGVGSLLWINSGYAISRDCKDPEAAWSFLRILLTQKYQEDNTYNFPTNRRLFEKQKQEAMTPTYIRDANGNFMLDPETGERQMETKGWTYDPITWESTPIYAYTAEQVAQVEQLIEMTVRVPDNNQALLDIVRDEAQAFFAGQRSAEEIVKLIQSKANIYVNEQR